MDGKEGSLPLLKAAEHSELSFQIVERLNGIRSHNMILLIHVEWEVLPDQDDWTWEPIH